MKVLAAQSCPALCDPMDCSPPGSSVHGIFQARILEWDSIAFSRGSSWPRDRIRVSCIAGRFVTIWATLVRRLRWTLTSGGSELSEVGCVALSSCAPYLHLFPALLLLSHCPWGPVFLSGSMVEQLPYFSHTSLPGALISFLECPLPMISWCLEVPY